MSHRSVKVKRSGIEKIFSKAKPFRAWLDEQPRNSLTHRESSIERSGTGWRTEDFIREAWKRGLELRIGTVNKWLAGAQPRVMALNDLRKTFPTITF